MVIMVLVTSNSTRLLRSFVLKVTLNECNKSGGKEATGLLIDRHKGSKEPVVQHATSLENHPIWKIQIRFEGWRIEFNSTSASVVSYYSFWWKSLQAALLVVLFLYFLTFKKQIKMTDSSIYQTCSTQFDPNEDLGGLLQCISDGHDTVRMQTPKWLVLVLASDDFSNRKLFLCRRLEMTRPEAWQQEWTRYVDALTRSCMSTECGFSAIISDEFQYLVH